MTPDRLTTLLGDAVATYGIPPYPAQTIATRIAQAPAFAEPSRRPVRAIAVGGLIVLAAVAAAVPKTYVVPEPVLHTMERLTGHRWRPIRVYEVPKRSLEEVRQHTTFPIVVPRGIRVLEADSFGPNKGVTLTVTIDGRNQVQLVEQWAKDRKPSGLDGVGIHNDGSIRRFNVRRWQMDGIDYSVTMFDPTYHAFAVKIEQAIRDTVAARRLADKPMLPLESREVSLDEARAAADFPVLVPLDVRLVRVLLATDSARERSFVSLVLQDGRGSQIQLEEMRAIPIPAGKKISPSYQVEPDGRVIRLETMSWTAGETRVFTVLPFDARSRAFALRIRRAMSTAPAPDENRR